MKSFWVLAAFANAILDFEFRNTGEQKETSFVTKSFVEGARKALP